MTTKTTIRNADLWQMLSKRRREILDAVHSRIHEGRDRPIEGRDGLEHADADAQGEIEFTLIQAKSETLARIDEALARLNAGTYGSCVECDSDISEKRLMALPFAARCQKCEQRRETEQGGARLRGQQRGLSLFSDVTSS